MNWGAHGAALCRLIEQGEPRALRQFDDPVVERLVDPMTATGMTVDFLRQSFLDSLPPGTYGGIVMRARYIDDVVTAWADSGQTQLVILGAGLDTRAQRLPALSGTTVFEVDLPRIQRDKQRALAGVRPLAADVRYLPVDLGRQTLSEPLRAAGFDPERPALFVWEGVTQYLDERAVRSTLAFVGGTVAGSMLVFTYIVASMLNSASPWAMSAARGREDWIFGLDPDRLTEFLGAFHLTLMDHVGVADYEERYLEPAGRELVVNPCERVALAGVGPRAS
ncbi:MAG: SAM-dependent methyltransferase [Propionicimonas sp.]|uniref:class I SAM-dependent methyltransferase n=1 Tax=Propionicimonas sp. TaxID=1955623 RepID=UPI003D0DF6D2